MVPRESGASGWEAAGSRPEADARALARFIPPHLAIATPTFRKVTSTFAPAEREALAALRSRYQDHRGLFSDRELARLHFMRWLHQTHR